MRDDAMGRLQPIPSSESWPPWRSGGGDGGAGSLLPVVSLASGLARAEVDVSSCELRVRGCRRVVVLRDVHLKKGSLWRE